MPLLCTLSGTAGPNVSEDLMAAGCSDDQNSLWYFESTGLAPDQCAQTKDDMCTVGPLWRV